MERKYCTNPGDIYTEELEKLLRCFSDIQHLGEEAGGMNRIGWRHVEYLRQVNFILIQAVLTGEVLVGIGLK